MEREEFIKVKSALHHLLKFILDYTTLLEENKKKLLEKCLEYLETAFFFRNKIFIDKNDFLQELIQSKENNIQGVLECVEKLMSFIESKGHKNFDENFFAEKTVKDLFSIFMIRKDFNQPNYQHLITLLSFILKKTNELERKINIQNCIDFIKISQKLSLTTNKLNETNKNLGSKNNLSSCSGQVLVNHQVMSDMMKIQNKTNPLKNNSPSLTYLPPSSHGNDNKQQTTSVPTTITRNLNTT